MEIKEVKLKDLDDAWDIIDADAKWLNSNGLDHWITYYTRDLMTEKLNSGIVFCLYENKSPVATVSISNENPSYYPKVDIEKFTKVERSIYISALAVHPDYHNKGYAKEILKFCFEYCLANKINSIRFDARAKYTELIEFYKKQDFKIAGIMDDEGEDYVLFEKLVN